MSTVHETVSIWRSGKWKEIRISEIDIQGASLPQKYIMPDTFVKVINTQSMTNNDPIRSERRQKVAMLMARVAKLTFRYNSPRMIWNMILKLTENLIKNSRVDQNTYFIYFPHRIHVRKWEISPIKFGVFENWFNSVHGFGSIFWTGKGFVLDFNNSDLKIT